MLTLPAMQLQCNPNIQLSCDGGQLTNDAGLSLLLEFCHRFHFDQLLRETVHFEDQRKFYTVSYADICFQKILLNIAGYRHDVRANDFKADPAMTAILGEQSLVSQPSLSRFFAILTPANLDELRELIWQTAVPAFRYRKQRQFVLDIDSTHLDTFGNQEATAYNAHYMVKGYHPQVVFENTGSLLLDAYVRSGNTYTGKDADQFIQRTFDHLETLDPGVEVVIRGDSGFAMPAFYEACTSRDFYFIVRLKANQRLKALGEKIIASVPVDDEKDQVVYHELDYQAASWREPYRVIMCSEHTAGELGLWTQTFLVTNMVESPAEVLFPAYQGRGNVENDIKELKNGFGFDQTDSTTFIRNTARALISGVAYNLIQLFKVLLIPEDPRITIDTLRFRLFHIAGRVTRHAGKVILHLASNYANRNWFWDLLAHTQQLLL